MIGCDSACGYSPLRPRCCSSGTRGLNEATAWSQAEIPPVINGFNTLVNYTLGKSYTNEVKDSYFLIRS